MPKRDAVFPANPHALFTAHHYSPAIRSGGFLFVSGMVGARPDGSAEPDLTEEIRVAFDNLVATLAAAGLTFDDVVDTTLFMVDPEAVFPALLTVLPDHWGEPPYSNITAVGVTWLAGFRFEIKVVAKLRDEAQA